MRSTALSRRIFLNVVGTIAVCLWITGCTTIPFTTKTVKPFSLVVLPDTQFYSEQYPDIFTAQTRWIRDQKDTLNIVAVLHEGDIVQNPGNEEEWKVADEAISVLDGVTPYFLAVGNHDMVAHGQYPLFNKYFAASRFKDQTWYGGHIAKGNEDAYYFFSAAGMKFMVVCLEYEPSVDVLNWANEITSTHRQRRTIVLTHCYMNSDNTRVPGRCGEGIWNEYGRHHQNIFLILSGHVAGTGRLTSNGAHQNPVHQILADYQHLPNGGNGWLRIMTFVPQENKIKVQTYSPVLDRYWTDAQNQFEFEYEMIDREEEGS